MLAKTGADVQGLSQEKPSFAITERACGSAALRKDGHLLEAWSESGLRQLRTWARHLGSKWFTTAVACKCSSSPRRHRADDLGANPGFSSSDLRHCRSISVCGPFHATCLRSYDANARGVCTVFVRMLAPLQYVARTWHQLSRCLGLARLVIGSALRFFVQLSLYDLVAGVSVAARDSGCTTDLLIVTGCLRTAFWQASSFSSTGRAWK